MLKKKSRVNTAMFKEVFAKGRSFHFGTFFLKTLFVEEGGPFFSFVVSKKVAKRAVARNKIKRRARSIVHKQLPFFKKKIAVVVFFKKGAEKLLFKEIETVLVEGFKKAKILR